MPKISDAVDGLKVDQNECMRYSPPLFLIKQISLIPLHMRSTFCLYAVSFLVEGSHIDEITACSAI